MKEVSAQGGTEYQRSLFFNDKMDVVVILAKTKLIVVVNIIL